MNAAYFESRKTIIRIVCAFLAFAGFIIDKIAYYPGFVSPDTLDQYTQAINNAYSDWHPPIMAAFWHLLLMIDKGTESMFYLQLLLYWGSFYILMMVFVKHFFKLAFLILLFFYAPFMQNFVGNIWKDIALALSWLFALSLMIHAFYESRKLNKFEAFLTLLLLSYGCWIRFNALPGVIPLLTFWIWSVSKKENSTPRILIKTVLLTTLLALLQIGITKILIKPIKTFPEYKLFVHDLTGIYKETGKLYFPDFILKHPGFDSLYIKEKYIYSTFDNIWWNPDGKNILPNANTAQMHELRNRWFLAIWDHPGTYLSNRFKGLLNFLRITESGTTLTVMFPHVQPNNFGLELEPNLLTYIFVEKINSTARFFFMKPWFWFLFNIILLMIVFIKPLLKIRIIVLCLTLSSLFYFLLEFVIFQADTEFRYFYWNCVALSLAFLLIVSELSYGRIRSKAGHETK